jgi:histidine triad (HIT) family protein
MTPANNPDCIFCKIVAGTIPAKRLYEDDQVIAFADQNPQAPTHLLVVPKEHLSSLATAAADHTTLLGQLLAATTEIARQQSLAKGYRVVINTGPDGGQTVDHLHLHLLGGRPMHWPPG